MDKHECVPVKLYKTRHQTLVGGVELVDFRVAQQETRQVWAGREIRGLIIDLFH